MRHTGCDFFQIVKEKAIYFHESATAIGVEELVWIVAVEEYFTVSTFQKRDRERYLIEHIIIESTCE